MNNSLEAATLKVYTTGTETVVTTAEVTTSEISFNVVAGTYDIVITRPGFLKYTIQNVVVAEEAVALGTVALTPGDMNADDIVNTDNLGVVIAGFGTATGRQGYEIELDINGDGVIHADDLTPVVLAFADKATVTTLQ